MANEETPAPELEVAIRVRGEALLADIKPRRLIALTPAWWQERTLEWAAGDPEFRVKLLRFVDVLPALRTSGAVADHVRQYFRDGTPAPIRLGSRVAEGAPFRPVLSRVVRQGVFSMADRFIGGATPAEALPRLRELAENGTGHTIDLLGEATLSNAEADTYRDRYIDLLRQLDEGRRQWDAPAFAERPNISVKLSALSAPFEPAAPAATSADVLPRLLPVLMEARAREAFVYVDMEQYHYRDLIHAIVADALADHRLDGWDGLGVVVQAYLKDAPGDIERLAALAEARGVPITVRLVKGAYWDEEVIVARQDGHPVPVFEDKAATDASYERCTTQLLAAFPHLLPAFASHNPRSVAQAMVRAEAAGLAPGDIEFQVLYGMAEGLRGAIHDSGYRTRVYVPAGEIIPGMAYLVRRLLENTSNESWFLHRHEEADPDVALEPPVPAPEQPQWIPPGFANHPPLQLFADEVRTAMQAAVDSTRSIFGGDYPLLINGETLETGEWDEVRYPADPSLLIGRVARANRNHVDLTVEAAEEVVDAWRDTPAADRAAILRKAADLMAERRLDLAATMVFESAKPWREADGDVTEAIDFLRHYANEAERLGAGTDMSRVPGEENRYLYEGRGIVAVIAPWNFPLAILTGMTTGALAGGCAAILKPAGQSPIIASRLVTLLHEAGVPGGVVQYLPGPGREVGQALVEHPRVQMVAFTGSNAVGLGIIEAAAKVRPGQRDIKRVIAELGGKNAIIVDDDADLDQAVAGVVASAFGYAGQKCSACSRVVVVGSAYPQFRERLADAVRSLVVGPPDDPFTFVPPVISAAARKLIDEYIAIGRADGTLVAAATAPTGPGHYVAPHVFEGLPLESRLACEEVFGPVLALFRADSFDEALDIALSSDFALTGGLFSRNPRNIARAREAFRVGNLYINRKTTGAAVMRQPFAGFHMSGTGDRAGGPDYVQQFMVTRVVTENTMRRGFAPDAGHHAT